MLEYVIFVSDILPPPDLNVTVGVFIVSLAVKVRVTILPTFASVVDVRLFEIILTLLKVGSVILL